jgi:gamma-glutamyl:cysteine ligase YbdK (ATP-grasp superfamily)
MPQKRRKAALADRAAPGTRRTLRTGLNFAECRPVGTELKREHFNEAERLLFKQRLHEQLAQLERVLKQPGFSQRPRSLGAELELCLIDSHGRAFGISDQIVRAANTPVITPEMGTFDIELSTPPVSIAGAPLSKLRESMQTSVRRISNLCEPRGARAIPISILPTLRREDFDNDAITDLPRYRALTRGLKRARGVPFELAIDGDDALRITSYDVVAMEAANSAFQMHVSVSPEEFRDLFNAAMLLSAPVLAAAANSATFLGKRLWHETRVALFKQAGDDRPPAADSDMALPPRVNFGNNWVREGAHELFLESVALHRPLLFECAPEEDGEALLESGRAPALSELRLHHGTVWAWNRPVYDPSGDGNLRIELRALPAGPTYDDMLANAGFLVGAMLALKERMPSLTQALPFSLARQNFFAAAQHGLSAELSWPSQDGGAPQKCSAREILLSLLPAAHAGLREAGIDADERARFLSIFEERVRSGRTAAVWQRSVLAELSARGLSTDEALKEMLERYVLGFRSQRPVHAWSVDDYEPGGLRV